MRAEIVVSSDIVRSTRVMLCEGIFDIPPTERSEQRWQVELPIEDRPWNIGLVVGPSGCGKSTIARKLFPTQLDTRFAWPAERSLLDAFPEDMSVKDIIALLSSVGFSSPPSWMRPFGVLSNGEQFRVGLARVLAEAPDLAVVDEFTSVVDRTVAQIGSAALAKTVRRRGQKFVAVTCHEDVEAWLQPDWVYRPAEQRFAWRSLQRRPPIELTIQRVDHSAWRLFKHHHYMSGDLNRSAVCFIAFWKGVPVAFTAWLPFVGRLAGKQKGKRGHRSVCLPDYQGAGIGSALLDYVGSLWTGLGYRCFGVTSSPAIIQHRIRTGLWKMTREASPTARDNRESFQDSRATTRMTTSFEYVGPKLDPVQGADVLDTWAYVRAA